MRIRYLVAILVCFGLAVVSVHAQMPARTPNSGLQYSADMPEENQLQLGLGASASYDDNSFNTIPGNGQALFSATPKISWNINRSHWTSLLSYSALISRSTRYDFYSRTSHTFNTDFNYRFSKSLSFNVTDSFLHSADPLYNSGQFGSSTAGAPNSSFLGQTAVRTSNFTDAEADYRLDARSTVTVGGGFYFARYSDVPNASLRDSNDATVRASFRHAFSARQSTGASYDFARITTPAGYNTISHRISLTEDITFRPDMSLSLFAGPNYVSNEFPVQINGASSSIQNGGWTWSAGGTYTWTLPRMRMVGSAIHQVSDGGGLIGSTELTTFLYTLDGRLPHKFRGSIYAGYNLNDRVNFQANGVTTAKYASAGGSLSHDLTRNLIASISYGRMEQLLGTTTANPWIPRDRVTVSLTYNFTHPLGR